jgi:hypothetical protein
MAIDDRTSVFDFPKPNQDNTLLEDVARLRAALDAIDAAIQGRQAALSFTPENAVNKGATNGYAGLDGAARVPTSQLPSVATQLGFTPENVSNKGAANGYAGLDGAARVPTSQLPSVATQLGFTPENVSNKGAANGYAGLDSGGKVPAVQLPSFVDDVLEFASLAAFPGAGESGKIYVALDTGKTYRWGGSAYAEISAAPGSTDAVPEGGSNLYFTSARALAAVPVATASVPGRVKPGTGLSVAGDGTLNATGSDQTFDDLTLTISSNGQTAFTVSGGYVPGAIDVHLNGVKLNGGSDDYTATNGTSITLTVGANTADLLVLRRWGTFEVANAVTVTGAQTLTNKTIDGNLNNIINVGAPEIKTPTNVGPASGATGIGEAPTLTSSPYYSLYGIPMAAAQWQVSTSSAFGTTVVSTGDVAGTAVAYTVAVGLLSVSTSYFWRVRYKDDNGVYSDWSTPTSFTTSASFNNYIATPTATPSNFGDALEGGFYAGLVWNEATTSSTSRTLATGTQTFTTTANMASTPLFYAGQQLEVRSRANPANRFQGTVTGAGGTTLTLNVATITGSGTFSDWSIMSRYRVIVAPKSSGENAAVAWKNANTAGPVATQTLNEGWKATEAMRLADTSTVYPAAHWARNLSINSRTDWYIPARDELELLWRNLKPVTNNNYTTADRDTGATADYLRDGAFNASPNTHGTNNNTAPNGAAYTTTVPGQVAATAFRTGGAEAFEFGSAYYWSSTQYTASNAWYQYWDSSFPGYQDNNVKTDTCRARAVRRSII